MADDKTKDKKKKGELKGFDPAKYIEVNPELSEQIKEIVEAFLSERKPLTVSQRRQRALTMRRYKNKIARARKRASKKRASKEVLMRRARKKARNLIKKRLMKSKDYSEMSPAEKMALDKRMQRISSRRIDTLAKRQLPKVRAAEVERLRGATKSESVKQDTDIKDKKGTQPAKYFSGLAPSTKDKRDAHFKKKAKMDDDNPAAYAPAPGDAEAKTKPSKHTKRYQQMFGESLNESIELDFQYMIENVELLEADAEKALKNKAKETGMPYGILKKVFDRGVAAWRTGHRPGTTPVQWGLARVNSFVTKGKGTWGKADKDLASQVKNENVNEDKGSVKHHLGIGSTFKHMQKHALRHVDYDNDGDVDDDDFKKLVPDEITGAEKKDYTKIAAKKNKDELKHTKKGVAFESVFTEQDLLEFKILDEAGILDKALSAIHKHVMKGVPLGDIAYDVSRAAGVNLSGRQLEKEYISQYGEPNTGKKTNPASAKALAKKYGVKMEGEYTDAAKDQIEREKEVDQIRHQRMLDDAQERDAEAAKEKKESANPSDREEGTDSLVKIYKKATPGENIKEAALDAPIKKGDRVGFNHDTLDKEDSEMEGTLIGTDPQTGRMKIRDDQMKLFIVKHQNAEKL